jgi:hypothetical protein
MFCAKYELKLKKQLSIYCALGEVSAEAGKKIQL